MEQDKLNLMVTEAPLREAKEQLCKALPDSVYLVGDDDLEELVLMLFYKALPEEI